MSLIVFLLVVGFLTYWLIRHPVMSMKIVGAGLGLLLLGTVVSVGILIAIYFLYQSVLQ
jgi:hypothetical protein